MRNPMLPGGLLGSLQTLGECAHNHTHSYMNENKTFMKIRYRVVEEDIWCSHTHTHTHTKITEVRWERDSALSSNLRHVSHTLHKDFFHVLSENQHLLQRGADPTKLGEEGRRAGSGLSSR